MEGSGLHVISRRTLREFWDQYPDAQEPLNEWFKAASRATWQNIAEVKQMYSHADAAGECTIFNIRGNNYRLIVKIRYDKQTIYIRFVLTHVEYNKEKWKNGCNC
jgi:mRNA interferase HigB